jgi:hypothetical protein
LDSGLGSVIPETLLKKQISVVLHSDWFTVQLKMQTKKCRW